MDEFQDVNQAQYDVVRMLAEPENNLFVSFPLWKPNLLKREKSAFSVMEETVKAPVRIIISWV